MVRCTPYTCQEERSRGSRALGRRRWEGLAQLEAERRVPLNRDRVLRAAVALADEAGIDARCTASPAATGTALLARVDKMAWFIDVSLPRTAYVSTGLCGPPAALHRPTVAPSWVPFREL
jgi:hypothetical protein